MIIIITYINMITSAEKKNFCMRNNNHHTRQSFVSHADSVSKHDASVYESMFFVITLSIFIITDK